ncbi:MAG: hypothetical protein K0S27_1078 [Gammaproteobacteria bacterium]|jgi:uncharacterized membrane protein YuzA (DUF378 family)|nr:hypothetical protein [Gammaproteobacteria bacterium]
MKKHGPLGWIAWILVVIGGLNWGLVGINSNYNLVAMLLGTDTTPARAVYIAVGIAALFVIYFKITGLKNK